MVRRSFDAAVTPASAARVARGSCAPAPAARRAVVRNVASAVAVAASLVIAGAACSSSGADTGPPAETTTTSLDPAGADQLGGAAGTATGDPAVDAVLARLEGSLAPSLTVDYTVERKLGPVRASARLVHGEPRTSVTANRVRYLIGTDPHTCRLDAAVCEDGINDAWISDLGVGAGFWRDSPARALRVAAARRTGSPSASSQSVAGADAVCVDVPVGTGVEHYCAFTAGAIARWDTAYVAIEATSFAATVDERAFNTAG